MIRINLCLSTLVKIGCLHQKGCHPWLLTKDRFICSSASPGNFVFQNYSCLLELLVPIRIIRSLKSNHQRFDFLNNSVKPSTVNCSVSPGSFAFFNYYFSLELFVLIRIIPLFPILIKYSTFWIVR